MDQLAPTNRQRFPAVVGTYAAVWRDLPILSAFNRPATTTGHFAAHVVCAVFLSTIALDYFGFKIGGASPLGYSWTLVLVYLGWCVETNLRSDNA